MIEVPLPESDSPREVLATMHGLLRALGHELGDHYDAQLRTSIGSDWLRQLGRERKKRLTLHDAQFVLAEPLHNADSPTRQCLPSGGACLNAIEDALIVRNRWAHHEAEPLTLAVLQPDVAKIRALASLLGLRLASACSSIEKRIRDVQTGRYEATVSLGSDLAFELQTAQEREASLRLEVEAAQALLDEVAKQHGSLSAQRDAERKSALNLKSQLEEALADRDRLEFILEGLKSVDTSASTNTSTPLALAIGDAWTDAVPARRASMMALQPDLVDEVTGSSIVEEFGPACLETIRSWRGVVSPRQTVFLTPEGHAAAIVDGQLTYLGCLGAERRANVDGALSGFFTGHTYTLRMNGSIEARETGDVLAAVNPEHASAVSSRLLDLAPQGGRLRVTTDGTVAVATENGWRAIAKVSNEEWFPRHLP